MTITRSIVSKNTSPEGGGVVEDGAGTLNVVDSTISENKTMGGTFLDGGGVLRDTTGTVNISGSTIVGNTAGTTGAGIEDVGGGGTIAISNSTITGNHSAGRGGGIHTFGPGAITLTNVTVHDNISDTGADEIDNCNDIPACGTTPHTVTLKNTIVASGGVNCTGPITSGGHNIDTGTTCGFSAASGDLPGMGPAARHARRQRRADPHPFGPASRPRSTPAIRLRAPPPTSAASGVLSGRRATSGRSERTGRPPRPPP